MFRLGLKGHLKSENYNRVLGIFTYHISFWGLDSDNSIGIGSGKLVSNCFIGRLKWNGLRLSQ